MQRSAYVLLALALFAPGAAEARCAPSRLVVSLVTPTNAPIPVGASLLALVSKSFEHTSSPTVTRTDDGGVMITGLALVRGDTRIALRSEVIAAGLVRLVPEQPTTEGTYLLTGFANTLMTGETVERRIELTVRGALPPVPEAVSVTDARATDRVTGTTRWGERHAYRATYTLSRALPIGVARVAIVTRSGASVATPGSGRELTISGEYGGEHCGSGLVPGEVIPGVGQEVHLVLVDRYARVVTSDARVRVR